MITVVLCFWFVIRILDFWQWFSAIFSSSVTKLAYQYCHTYRDTYKECSSTWRCPWCSNTRKNSRIWPYKCFLVVLVSWVYLQVKWTNWATSVCNRADHDMGTYTYIFPVLKSSVNSPSLVNLNFARNYLYCYPYGITIALEQNTGIFSAMSKYCWCLCEVKQPRST